LAVSPFLLDFTREILYEVSMGKLYSLFVLAFLYVGTSFGQGTFLFTWHGDSNVFQASFEVTGAEMQPGALFSSPLFLNSMAVTNPLGQTYYASDATSGGSGSYIPWVLGYQINDFQRSTEVLLHSGEYAGSQYRTSGDIREQNFSGVGIFYERGYWTFAQIPEPSPILLFGLGGVISVCAAARKR
jgi:hypothetical protein